MAPKFKTYHILIYLFLDQEKASHHDDNIKLTREYQNALTDIFHQLDLDQSETLSREEFSLYNWRTSSQEMTVSFFRLLIFIKPFKS